MDAPPPGPPPPRVPEGWKAVWNSQYSEWFYVNTYTRASTWERPTEPARRPESPSSPMGAPPSYGGGASPSHHSNEKLNPNNPYNQTSSTASRSQNDIDADARLAAQLQAEEDAARRRGGASTDYYSGNSPSGSTPVPGYDTRDQSGQQKRGLMGKLMGKLGGGSSHQVQQGYGQQPGYGNQGGYRPGYGPQQGGYPPQGGYGGYPPQPGYGGYPPGQYYGGGPQYQQQAPAKSGGGLGMAGGAALGLGGGLVGGMLLENAISDHDQGGYDQGYDQGYDNGQDNGDMGGGDMGGGDF